MNKIKTITNIADIQALLLAGEVNWEKYGQVQTDTSGDLVLFSYTNKAMYTNTWNIFEQLSRGLILNRLTGEIVARPFLKFFNWGQLYGNTKAIPHWGTHLVHVFEKLDGSLGILYRQDGFKVATRGSFTSEQAVTATEMLKLHQLGGLPDNLTLLFEIIYPENRIVVDYGDRAELVLLAAVNRFTGKEVSFYGDGSGLSCIELAFECGFSTPRVFNFNNPSEVIEVAGRVEGSKEEGYVLLYSDGSRFKIKGDDYLAIHKIISRLTKKNVFKLWVENASLPHIPDEFLEVVNSWFDEFELQYINLKLAVDILWEKAPKSTRKEFALFVTNTQLSDVELAPALFARFDRDLSRERLVLYSLMEARLQD